jgi:hypothetical protein
MRFFNVAQGGYSSPGNAAVSSRVEVNAIVRQMVTGWTTNDLRGWDGEIRLDRGAVEFAGPSATDPAIEGALASLVGQCRICLLYTASSADGRSDSIVRGAGFVAGRVLAVRKSEAGTREFVFQPAVMITKTAVVTLPGQMSSAGGVPANPYIYRLQLTR